jgi:MarR family transcriptional regulator, 2-MHQ and catechol-resistance regulon repressor
MPTHYPGTAKERRALNAYINLIRASESILARTGGRLDEEELTLGQFGALEALLHLGPLTQRELGDKLLRSGGNITVVVNNLERHGWARRERPQSDRRIALLHLTAEGRGLIERVFARHVRGIVSEMGRLDAEEQEELRRLCRKLGRGEQIVSSGKARSGAAQVERTRGSAPRSKRGQSKATATRREEKHHAAGSTE